MLLLFDSFSETKANKEVCMVALDFSKMGGLVPAIVQDHDSGEVLMLAFMNQGAWEKTLESGKATYYSRSRDKLWVKGESSGHVQLVREIRVDCDSDTILLKVEQLGGAACHLGYKSCFFRKVSDGRLETTETRIFDPDEVYSK
ncbi:MAG: phosphoribosyl-AMP cyclohydrolase [Desulfosalsimonadaceae bacterium]